MRILLIVLLTAISLIGCDKDKVRKAQTVAQGATSRLSQEYDDLKVLSHAQQFVSAVESRDAGSLRRLCDQGDGDYKAILNCYYSAFVIENDQGVDATRKYLVAEMAKDNNSPAKSKAVGALNEYFVAKGSLRTKEVAAAVLIIALECKYPHQGGKLGKVIADKLGLMDLPKSTTQPTSQSCSRPAPGN